MATETFNYDFLLQLNDFTFPSPMFLDSNINPQIDSLYSYFEGFSQEESSSTLSSKEFIAESNFCESPFMDELNDNSSFPKEDLDCSILASPSSSSGIGIEENRFENLFFENVVSIQTCTTSVFAREGRNGNFTLSNNSPEKCHKSRRFEVKVPKTGYSYCIAIVISQVGGIVTSPVVPSLSYDETKKGSSPLFDITFTSNGQQNELFSFYLHTMKSQFEKLKQSNTEYHLEISLIRNTNVNPKSTTLHEFNFISLKSHKFESSLKGREQNARNNTIVETLI